MAIERINITSPVGRFVAGNLYKPNTTDFDGKPLVVKTGPNAGQPRVQYFMALAIPKTGENHWALTEWGKQIWALGHQAFPQAAQRPDFAWKIDDGDSQIPNKKNRRPCDQEGYPGNWILKLSGGFAPKIVIQEGNQWVENLQPNVIKPGYYVQAAFSVDENGQQNNPGVYLNLQMIALRGYGPEINFGPNVEEAGFGAAPLPAGASPVPLAATLPAAPPIGNAQYNPPPPAYMPAPAAAPVPVAPNPGFVQMPPPGGFQQAPPANYPPPPNPTPAVNGPGAPMPAAGAIPPPPASAAPFNAHQMTAAAGNVGYEAYRAAGWSDAQLIANGLMLA